MQVTHLHRYIERKSHTVNTTLCGRVSSAGADYNVSDKSNEVTCKFCLKLMAKKEAA